MRTWYPATLFLLPVAFACSGNDGREGSGCPNTNNCIMPLVCVDNICQQPVAGRDAGVERDGGVVVRDGGVERDGGVAPDETITAGTLTVTSSGTAEGFAALAGSGAMVREATGYTSVRVEVSGLTASTTFSTHVHVEPCSTGGGGHYKIDETVNDVVQANEIWPVIMADANGDGVGMARVNHYARPDARSIVIHEPVDALRIACLDLAPNGNVTASGTFAELPTGAGSGITGSATLRRSPAGTVASVSLSGALTADATYPIHVHASPCDVMAGGPHYKIDTAVMETEPDNEIWPNATADAAGAMAMGTATVDHIARFDAQSMVVHDPDTNDRLLCADLRW